MTKLEEDNQKEIELAIRNTAQFIDYAKYQQLIPDPLEKEIFELYKNNLVFRLKEWKKDNRDYFTIGELCGIEHVINMLVAGKI
jgi:hypothetical protein